MAIIKYTLVNGQTPSGISSGGVWQHPNDNTYIGIGSGIGTELSVNELKRYVKALKSLTKMRYIEYGDHPNSRNLIKDNPDPTVDRQPTDAEIELAVDNWCTAKGIS